MIPGITTIAGPSRGPNAGYFNLPPEFDQKKFVSQWSKKGSEVEQAQQVQPIMGTNYGADGWTVWKYPQGHEQAGRLKEVVLKSGTYVLMFRPRPLQEAVNAICGNVSKRHLLSEQRGETLAGKPIPDPGILTDEQIKRGTGLREFGEETFQVQMNPEPSGAKVEAPATSNAET